MEKYYINQYIKNIAKQNNGEGNQNQEGNQTETDPIKIYINELATKSIEKGISYTNIIDDQSGSVVTLMPKQQYISIIQRFNANINSENKIGDENNNEFVIVEFPDDADFSNIQNLKTIFENSKFVFINEENTNYFLNKFIKVSTKQFMKSVLYSMDFENATNTIFDGLDINSKNFEEKIAINNLKFATINGIVINDIDLEAFYVLGNSGKIICIFDENENKIIFAYTIATYDNCYYCISFKFSNDPSNEIVTKNINETNYKMLRPGDISH